MYSLPIAVELNGASFGIRDKGDFRMVLDCFSALNDEELTAQERVWASLIIFYEDFDDLEDLAKDDLDLVSLQQEMFKFFNGGEDSVTSNTEGHNLIDWDKDSNLICSAVNNVAHTEVRALDYLHWWTFMGYYMAVGECPLSHIIGIRHKIANSEKLEKYEQKFIQDNPDYFTMDYRTAEQKEIDEYVQNLWSKG